MKLKAALLFSILSLSVISNVQAEGDREHSIGLGVGQFFLAGPYDSQGDDGIGYALRYNYLGTGDVFHLNVGFLGASLKGPSKLRVYGGNVGIKANFLYLDNLVPFGIAGLGFYRPSIVENNERIGSTTFGFNLGLGCDLIINDLFEIGGELSYHNPFDTEATTSTGNKVDLNGSFFTMMIHAGYRF